MEGLLKVYFLTHLTMIIAIFTLLILKQMHYFELLNVILCTQTLMKKNPLSLMNSHILFDYLCQTGQKMVRFSLENRSEFGQIFVPNSHK